MGDFPKPFSGNKTKKQSKDHLKKYKEAALFEAAILLSAGKPAKTRVFDFDEKLAAKEAPSERTKEAGGPNMISTGIAGVNPMTGVPQNNQLAPSPINPNAVGSLDVTSVAGQQVPGSYNRVMPPTGFQAPLQHKMKKTHIHPTEFTGKIETKEDGQEYSLIDLDGNQTVPDTLTPAGLKFPKGLVSKDGYLKGSMDLPAFKTGDKTFTLN